MLKESINRLFEEIRLLRKLATDEDLCMAQMGAESMCKLPITGEFSRNSNEVEKFSSMSSKWWEINGPLKTLHMLNPIRVKYILSQVGQVSNLKILDIGCGGGLVSEALARLGADVTGIDESKECIEVASSHAINFAKGCKLNYLCQSLKDFAGKKYDVILMLELLEHIDDRQNFFDLAKSMLKDDGVMIVSTINRTVKSMIFAKIAAEYVFGIVPFGTHQWGKFIKPDELQKMSSMEVKSTLGVKVCFDGQYYCQESVDLSVNYFMTLQKK